jgi:hypothetical protein
LRLFRLGCGVLQHRRHDGPVDRAGEAGGEAGVAAAVQDLAQRRGQRRVVYRQLVEVLPGLLGGGGVATGSGDNADEQRADGDREPQVGRDAELPGYCVQCTADDRGVDRVEPR